MGNGVVTQSGKGLSATENRAVTIDSTKSGVEKQLSFFSKFLGMSTETSDECAEQRQLVCIASWKDMSNTLHRYNDGTNLRGIELFCKMFLSNLSANDISESKYLFRAFKPRQGSHNYNSASILRRIVKYILSIRHESRNAKQNLRALGRTHARIKIERKEFDIFTVSFIETLILFPGVAISGEIIDSWAGLLKFAVDQMCFDKIVFKDHCTMSLDDHKLTNENSFDMETSFSTSHAITAASNMSTGSPYNGNELFRSRSAIGGDLALIDSQISNENNLVSSFD